MDHPIGRRGSSLPLVLAMVGLLGLLVAQLHRVTTGEAGLTRVLSEDAEHFYRAEAVASRVFNRLKKRPWPVRFYAQGGLGTGPWSQALEGEYRGGDWQLWVVDVEYGAARAVPGLVDLFCRVRYQGRERSFHYRVGLPEASTRTSAELTVEWFSRVPEDLATRVPAAVGLAQSLAAEAWKLGPASARGRELLAKAAEILAASEAELARSGLPELAALGPTWRSAVPLEAARVAVLAGDESRADEALVRASEAADGATLYGGGSQIDQVLAEALGPLRSASARARIGSTRALPPSGFAPLDPAEVETFVADPSVGWGGWPGDAGPQPEWWDDLAARERAREGEGGTGGPSGDIDRDGDGVLDSDTELDGPDRDGDGDADGSDEGEDEEEDEEENEDEEEDGPGVTVSVGVGGIGATATAGSSGVSAQAGLSGQQLAETRGEPRSNWALAEQADSAVFQNPGDPMRLQAGLSRCTVMFLEEPARMEACHRDVADRYVYFMGDSLASEMPIYRTGGGQVETLGTLVFDVQRGEGDAWYQASTIATRFVPSGGQ